MQTASPAGRRGWAAAAVVAALLARPVAAQPAPDPALLAVVGRYLHDPDANRAELLRLAADLDRVPSPFLLSVADAHLRAGRLDTASAVLAELVSRGADRPWPAWAELGLGWIALARGDRGTARTFYAHVAAGPDSADLARVLLHLLDAVEGHGDEAAPSLDRIAADARVDDLLRSGARLGAAYARYWSKDYQAAETAFAAVAGGEAPLVDDGRYGMAWARWRRGDRDGALALFRDLAHAEVAGGNPRRVTRALVELAPGAIFRASLDRYRTIRPGRPEDQLVPLLDIDGAALARAALRQLAPEEVPAAEPPAAATKVVGPAADPTTPVVPAQPRAWSPEPAGAAPDRADGSRVAWIVLLVATALGAIAVRARRRRRA